MPLIPRRSIFSRSKPTVMVPPPNLQERRFTDFWEAAREASAHAQIDPVSAELIYTVGINQFPFASPLLNNYALFLQDTPSRRGEAETLYKRAIDADPKNVNALANYASFLHDTSGRRREAEAFYRRAIDVDPRNAHVLSHYGLVTVYRPKDFSVA